MTTPDHREDILTNWEQVRCVVPSPDVDKKPSKSRRMGKAFKAALDWVTAKEPWLDYDERCKKAHQVSKIGISNGFRMPEKSASAKAAAIWQRQLKYKNVA